MNWRALKATTVIALLLGFGCLDRKGPKIDASPDVVVSGDVVVGQPDGLADGPMHAPDAGFLPDNASGGAGGMAGMSGLDSGLGGGSPGGAVDAEPRYDVPLGGNGGATGTGGIATDGGDAQITGGIVGGGGAIGTGGGTAGVPGIGGVIGTGGIIGSAGVPDAGTDVVTPALPVITSFTATPPTISVGSASQLTATFSGASTATINGGVGTVSSGVAVTTGTLSKTTTYTLTATNSAGASATKDVTVTVVPLPTITSFVAASTIISPGATTTLTATFSGGTGAIDKGVGAVTSGTGVTTPALSAKTTFTLTITNAAGATAIQQVTVTVQGFVVTGSMTVARSNGTATKLPNGKVLIAGGFNGTDYLSSAELYDPGTGLFAATGSMSTARMYHAAVLLNTGLVLVGGGERSGSSSRSTAELYNPATGTFATVAQVMNSQRQGSLTMTLLPSGKVLVAGGTSTDTTAELFDPLLGTNGLFGSVTAAMTMARDQHMATLITSGRFQGKVLLAGNGGAGSHTGEIYDPAGGTNGTFTACDNTMAEGRAMAAGVALTGGKVLLAGGFNMAGMTRSVMLYDSAAGTIGSFSTVNPLTVSRRTPSGALLTNGKVLIAAGSSDRSADLYDPATGTVTSAGTMVAQRQYQMAAMLDDGRVLIAGGVDESTHATASAELYVY